MARTPSYKLLLQTLISVSRRSCPILFAFGVLGAAQAEFVQGAHNAIRVVAEQSVQVAGVKELYALQDTSGSVHLFMRSIDDDADVVRHVVLTKDDKSMGIPKEVVRGTNVYFSTGLWDGLPAIVWQDDGQHIDLQFDLDSPTPRTIRVLACPDGSIYGSPSICSGPEGGSRILWNCLHPDPPQTAQLLRKGKGVSLVEAFAESQKKLIACHSRTVMTDSAARSQGDPQTILLKKGDHGPPYLICPLPATDVLFDVGPEGLGGYCCSVYRLPRKDAVPVRVECLALETKTVWIFAPLAGEGFLVVAEGPFDEEDGSHDLFCALSDNRSKAEIELAVKQRGFRCGDPHALFNSHNDPILLIWKGPAKKLVYCIRENGTWSSPVDTDAIASEEMAAVVTGKNLGCLAVAVPDRVIIYSISWQTQTVDSER